MGCAEGGEHLAAVVDDAFPGQPAWPLSPYPDADCFIFLAEDFHFGSSGHPGKGLSAVR
ncbi:DUF2716 domain-containing protein [Streptomyces lancefieldiae]|uniref:DUF2716 domain-containing protein n=1 Tax=Streptomyces lancefieldiae TaxID=3075520 RepID=A0ABU3AQM2_9ACTN|nr:DUF2716 domain-containing protein [Streptomyces sp. DSM 40712]MDT0612125.1 DUF2716 domain-containing protein [Streptomyces sp. DSM 40712]